MRWYLPKKGNFPQVSNLNFQTNKLNSSQYQKWANHKLATQKNNKK